MGRYLQTFSKVPVPGPQFSYLPPWSVNGRVSASISLPKSNFRHSFVFFCFFFHSLPVSIVPISHHPSVFFFKITANEPLFLLLVKKKKKIHFGRYHIRFLNQQTGKENQKQRQLLLLLLHVGQ